MGALAARRAGVPVLLSRRVEHMERWPVLELKLALADRVIAISRGINALLLQRGLRENKLVCIRDAVDVQAYQAPMARAAFNRLFDLPNEAIVVGVVAQLTPPKGHTYLLDALPPLVSEFPALRVLLFGRGPKEPQLRQQVQAGGLENVVRFCGYRTDMPALMGASTCWRIRPSAKGWVSRCWKPRAPACPLSAVRLAASRKLSSTGLPASQCRPPMRPA